MQHAFARGQTVTALSSAEAETYAAVSALAEAVHLQSVYTGFGVEVRIHLRLDYWAARAILLRTGPGAVRHLAVRALWAPDLFRSGKAKTQWVSGNANPADLGPMH